MAFIPKEYQRFRIDGSNVIVQYIKPTPSILAIIEPLLDCFRGSIGDNYALLRDSYESICMSSQKHRLIHGLVHILESRLSFETFSACDPVDLRMRLFEKAGAISGKDYAERDRWRTSLIKAMAQEVSLSPETIELGLYADLRDERRITAFDDLEADALVAEYNLSLAKSLLMYARSLVFTIVFMESTSQSVRKLFQSLRFFNLLFEVEQISESAYQFKVDCPASVLPQPQKYATSLASFLPTLYGFSSWHATAQVCLDERLATWQLKPTDFTPPVFYFPERIGQEAEQLSRRLVELDDALTIDSQVPILFLAPQSVWVPDFSVRHKVTQKKVYVEVLGYWRADYLNRRLKWIASATEPLILVLSEKLKLDHAILEDSPVEILHYKRTPRPQDVLKAIYRYGIDR